MAKQSHGLDHLLGSRMASSLSIPERRKSKAEIARMPIESQLIYMREHSESEDERQEALEIEDRDAHYQTTGEVDARDLLDNEPPPDWGR
jgi:hypothetical protein